MSFETAGCLRTCYSFSHSRRSDSVSSFIIIIKCSSESFTSTMASSSGVNRFAEVPRAVRDSADCQGRATFGDRCHFSRRGYVSQCFERMKLILCYDPTPREWEMAFARRASEVDYVNRLGRLLRDMEGSPLTAHLPQDAVCLQPMRREMDDGVPAGRESLDDVHFRPHARFRKFERRVRHANECFVAYHQREVLGVGKEASLVKFPRFTDWGRIWKFPMDSARRCLRFLVILG